MIEPTESENKARLDDFADVMIKIANEVKTSPQNVLDAPHTTPVKRVDETNAARHLDLRYEKD
ncbi:probable glycine dehydrogenase [decarboxylating] subunit 2 [Clostridium sp. CAG:306]|nr:probable glycine dehydrogenase [decarboxylating] subunit 2 [Clostridium sp. CAG:306]